MEGDGLAVGIHGVGCYLKNEDREFREANKEVGKKETVREMPGARWGLTGVASDDEAGHRRREGEAMLARAARHDFLKPRQRRSAGG